MKKLILAIIGLAFAFAVSSCDDQKKPKHTKQKCVGEKQEKHHERW